MKRILTLCLAALLAPTMLQAKPNDRANLRQQLQQDRAIVTAMEDAITVQIEAGAPSNADKKGLNAKSSCDFPAICTWEDELGVYWYTEYVQGFYLYQIHIAYYHGADEPEKTITKTRVAPY
jgi:hypothetical protein